MRGLNYAFPILLAMTASAGADPDTIERTPEPRPDPRMRGRTNRDPNALVGYGRWQRRYRRKTPTTPADHTAVKRAQQHRIRRQEKRLKAAGMPSDTKTVMAGHPKIPIARFSVSNHEKLPLSREEEARATERDPTDPHHLCLIHPCDSCRYWRDHS